MHRRTFLQSVAALSGSLALPGLLQAKKTLSDPNVLPTGIDGLDYCLNGGMTRGQLVMFVGGAGCGKSAIVRRIEEQARKLDRTKDLKILDLDSVCIDYRCHSPRMNMLRNATLNILKQRQFGVAMITIRPRLATMAATTEPYKSSPNSCFYFPSYIARLMKEENSLNFHGKIIKNRYEIPSHDFSFRVSQFGSQPVAIAVNP